MPPENQTPKPSVTTPVVPTAVQPVAASAPATVATQQPAKTVPAAAYNLGGVNGSGQENAGKLTLLQKLLGKTAPQPASVPIGVPVVSSVPAVVPAPGPGIPIGAAPAAPVSVLTPTPQAQTASLATLLGPKPVFSQKTYQDNEKRRQKITQILFACAVGLFFATYGFFYTQLNQKFTWFSNQLGPNLANRFDGSNNELHAKQTEVNVARFRMARLLLDEVNSQSDVFDRLLAQQGLDKTPLQSLETSLKNLLSIVQKIFAQPIGIDTYSREPVSQLERDKLFETLLRQRLELDRAVLTADSKTSPLELRTIDGVLRLFENRSLRASIAAQDFGKISQKDLSDLLAKIRQEGTDELSTANQLRADRLDWSQIIQDIHSATMKADGYYGQGLFKTVGGFLFNAYNFDTKTGRIGITGITKKSDSKTFSAIADLVDSIEKSPMFKDIDFRSFAKSKDENGDFSSSLNLEFALQKSGEVDLRDDVPNVTP